MKYILLLGAGRSSVYLIDYLVTHALEQDWYLTIADLNTNHLENKFAGSVRVTLLNIDIPNNEQINKQVSQSDLVISMLPASFHYRVAQTCLEIGRDLITASYVSPEIKLLHQKAQERGVFFLMECGLDPGIDHMSAMAAIKKIREKGGELYSFKSYTGGLVAPESDSNPWHYKISWNPRNVVLAGQGTASYLENNSIKYIPYTQLFSRTEIINVLEAGEFEGYANRDSLPYKNLYQLPELQTILRGTLRRSPFCQAWQLLIKIGLTDDSYTIPHSDALTNAQWLQAFLPSSTSPYISLPEQVATYLQCDVNGPEIQALQFLGLFEDEKITIPNATPAQILEQLLIEKLKLLPTDKDLVVMQHEFKYRADGKHHRLRSSLVVTGENATYTAMAKTVGLPIGIAAKLLLQNKINLTGVQIPVLAEIYEPIMEELKNYTIHFVEEEEQI